MTLSRTLYQHFQRYRTLQTDKILSLPIVILMPHSACNCRCVMCDIWKDNKNLKQLNEDDVNSLLVSLKKLGTQQVLMSGGEALLNPKFFCLCELLKAEGIRITLLSTGLTLEKNAEQVLQYVSDVIVSLDGDPATHDLIRNIPGAFQKMAAAVSLLKKLKSSFRITARTVIHRINFRKWPAIIETAKNMGVDQISFLPADVSSHAFNREVLWTEQKQNEILPGENELAELNKILGYILGKYSAEFENGFIAESRAKLSNIYAYYAACYGLTPFPFKKCNAPWVSAVVEADGTVRPCFFHEAIGNIHENSLEKILNSEKGMRFRKELDMKNNSTCVKCVCYLQLSPAAKLN